MTKTERFTFRLSPTERTALESYANQNHKTESRVLREALANILVPAADTRTWQNRSSYR
jgi:predicted transcriptional regulator